MSIPEEANKFVVQMDTLILAAITLLEKALDFAPCTGPEEKIYEAITVCKAALLSQKIED